MQSGLVHVFPKGLLRPCLQPHQLVDVKNNIKIFNSFHNLPVFLIKIFGKECLQALTGHLTEELLICCMIFKDTTWRTYEARFPSWSVNLTVRLCNSNFYWPTFVELLASVANKLLSKNFIIFKHMFGSMANTILLSLPFTKWKNRIVVFLWIQELSSS